MLLSYLSNTVPSTIMSLMLTLRSVLLHVLGCSEGTSAREHSWSDRSHCFFDLFDGWVLEKVTEYFWLLEPICLPNYDRLCHSILLMVWALSQRGNKCSTWTGGYLQFRGALASTWDANLKPFWSWIASFQWLRIGPKFRKGLKQCYFLTDLKS